MATTFNPTQAKTILQSLTFWGSVLTALAIAIPTVAAKFGLTTANAATDAQYIVQFIGVIIAIIGRFRATQPVTLMGTPEGNASKPAGAKLGG